MDFGSITRRLEGASGIRQVLAVQRRFSDDLAGVFASAITYHAFLSLFPLLLLAASVLGFLLEDPARQELWLREISATVPGLETLIGDTFAVLVNGRTGSGVVGAVGLAWTGTGVVKVAGSAMTVIKRLDHYEQMAHRIGWALGSMLGLGALAVSGATLTVLASVLPTEPPVQVALFIAVAAFDVLLFLIAYRVLTPGRGPAFTHLWPGSLVGGLLFMLLKLGGAWFAARAVVRAEGVYGPFAATVGVLVLLSLAVRAFLYGAVINAMRMERVTEQREPG